MPTTRRWQVREMPRHYRDQCGDVGPPKYVGKAKTVLQTSSLRGSGARELLQPHGYGKRFYRNSGNLYREGNFENGVLSGRGTEYFGGGAPL